MKQRELTVVVTAHPDDESMFFVPTVSSLVRSARSSDTTTDTSDVSHHVWLLCLTTGNYNRLGRVRAQELQCAADAILGLDRTILLNDDRFPDGPDTVWDVQVVADAIQVALSEAIQLLVLQHSTTTSRSSVDGVALAATNDAPTTAAAGIDTLRLVTFDEEGVSGHINHRDTFRAVRELWLRTKTKNNTSLLRLSHHVEAWSLQTIRNPFHKYVPMAEWARWLRYCCGFQEPAASSIKTETVWTLRLLRPSLNWMAMSAHRSQFVWYRRLFVIFSCYTYINLLRPIQLRKSEQQARNAMFLHQRQAKLD